MNSLVDPIDKFHQLQLKLRQLTRRRSPLRAPPTRFSGCPSAHNSNKVTQDPQPPPSFKKPTGENIPKIDQGQETERKNKRYAALTMHTLGPSDELLSQKHQALNQINALLEKKKEVLQQIERNMRSQASNVSQIFRNISQPLGVRMVMIAQGNPVKAPDLCRLREEKKARQRASLVGKARNF